MKEKLKFKSISTIKSVKEIPNSEEGNTIEIEGLATQSQFADGSPAVDRDKEIVDYSGFKLSANVFLYMHDPKLPIGKVELYQASDGIRYRGKIYENSHPVAYFNIKNKIVKSVSIGFSVDEYEYRNIEGEEVLTFTSGEIYEISAVSIGALQTASIDSVKGVIENNKCTGLSCSIKALKQNNPDCECLNGKKEGEIKTVKDTFKKALTWESTERDFSTQYEQKIESIMDIFEEVIESNWYGLMWNDALSGDEVKQNILDAIGMLSDRLSSEFSALISEVDKSANFNDSHEKTVITYNSAHGSDYPVADPDTPWSGPKEVTAADVDTLKKICAYVEAGREDVKAGYKFPHHRASDIAVVKNGCQIGITRIYQADVPESERRGIYNHLAKHLKDDFDIEPIAFSDLKKAFENGIEIKGKKMVIKNTETEPKEETAVEESVVEQPETPTEPTTETETPTEEAPKEPVVEESKKEEAPVETPIEEKPTEETPKEEPKEEAVPEKEPEPVSNIQTLIGTLSTFSLDNIETEEELEALDEQIDNLRNKLDAFYAEVVDEANQIIGENENEA